MLDDDAHQLVHGHHHVPHLVLGDDSIPVEVVDSECPGQLLLEGAVEQGGQGDQHVLDDHTVTGCSEELSIWRDIEP